MLLRELADELQPLNIIGSADNLEVDRLHYDSRRVEPGFLFVCVKGYQADGHDYAQQAVAKGAVALVVERPVTTQPAVPQLVVGDSRRALARLSAILHGRPSHRMTMVGVTGTNGKTTTTYLIEAILRKNGRSAGLIGTVGNRLGDRRWPAKHTTPESLELQQLLKEMADLGATYTVMEVSSHSLVLDRVAEVEFDLAVFTNLTQDHLDFHQDMDEYREAKGLLFKSLGDGVKARVKRAIINGDDPSGPYFAQVSTAPVVTYGMQEGAMVRAVDVKVAASGVSFLVRYQGGEFPVSLRLTGLFNVYNALAAIAVALVEGISPKVIAEALAAVSVPGRFETVDRGQPFAVVVDYAHTPDGLENVLETARAIAENRVIALFGCGGDRDRGKRPKMGAVAARLSDLAIVTSDNPRTEDPRAIIDEIIPGLKAVGKEDYLVIPDRREAIQKACRLAGPGDVLVIAGKGHEDYQIIGKETIHFDDREEAAKALEEMGYGKA